MTRVGCKLGFLGGGWRTRGHTVTLRVATVKLSLDQIGHHVINPSQSYFSSKQYLDLKSD